MLLALADETRVRALKPVKWEDVGIEVYLPIWEEHLRQHAPSLARVTPESLPDLAGNLLTFAMKLGDPEGGALSNEQRIGRAAQTLGAALAVALKKQGWVLSVLPGDEVCFQRGEVTIRPFQAIQHLASGQLQTDARRRQCQAAGISEVDLGCIAAGPAAG